MTRFPQTARNSAFSGLPQSRAWPGIVALLLVSACSAPASEVGSATLGVAAESTTSGDRTYGISYRLSPDPDAGGAWIDMEVSQSRALLREIDMQQRQIDADSVSGDGNLVIDNGRIVWTPPDEGGSITWFAPIDHIRSDGRYDAHINAEWAIFRASDVFPAAKTRTVRGAKSQTSLSFDLPTGWSSLTPYRGNRHRYTIDNPERRFDRPTGWFLLGNFGRRNETINGRRIVVAGPMGHAVRRMDILAFMHWTLPALTELLPRLPDRLTVVSAGEPMWRGGLSGPNSLFLHAERPLISENGTSTLMHEMMHVGMGLSGEAGADWIVEGLAEFYSLELLRRSGTISAKRYATALQHLAEWSEEAQTLCTERAAGPVTAKAVIVFHNLDGELRRQTTTDLDAVIRQLVTHDRDIGLADLQSVVRELAGSLPEAIETNNLPGCGS